MSNPSAGRPEAGGQGFMLVGFEECSIGRKAVRGGRSSDFSSGVVSHGSALLGIVAASTKREALNL